MIALLKEFMEMFLSTVLDVTPIVLLIGFFQIFVIKKNIPNIKKVIFGLALVIVGLAFFLIGLEKALFPVGEIMANQLSSKVFIQQTSSYGISDWRSYYWIYIFSLLIGFATTLAEPALKAVAIKAKQVSSGNFSEWGLRLVVAFGAGLALAIGMFRIVTGTELYIYLIACYIIVIIQTVFADKKMVALAYDTGGVTTSTVTVPIVAALGIGLSSTVPGRNPAMDGFGLIALVCMFPIITMLAYLQIVSIIAKFKKQKK